MADLSITAAQVVAAAAGNPSFETAYAGEAIAVGEAYYLKAADGKYWRAVNTSAAAAAARGICVAGAAAAGQRVCGQKTLAVTLGAGAAPAVGTPYFVSSNAGKLCPIGDLGTGAIVSLVGFGSGTNALTLGINNTAIVHA